MKWILASVIVAWAARWTPSSTEPPAGEIRRLAQYCYRAPDGSIWTNEAWSESERLQREAMRHFVSASQLRERVSSTETESSKPVSMKRLAQLRACFDPAAPLWCNLTTGQTAPSAAKLLQQSTDLSVEPELLHAARAAEFLRLHEPRPEVRRAISYKKRVLDEPIVYVEDLATYCCISPSRSEPSQRASLRLTIRTLATRTQGAIYCIEILPEPQAPLFESHRSFICELTVVRHPLDSDTAVALRSPWPPDIQVLLPGVEVKRLPANIGAVVLTSEEQRITWPLSRVDDALEPVPSISMETLLDSIDANPDAILIEDVRAELGEGHVEAIRDYLLLMSQWTADSAKTTCWPWLTPLTPEELSHEMNAGLQLQRWHLESKDYEFHWRSELVEAPE